MKRALSLALCAMMTVGNLPSVTYASDLSPTDTGVVSQAEEADETQSAEEAAQAYLKENFIDATDKVITTGGNGVVKSEDGLTYNIGLKIPNGGSINSLRLKYLNTVYKTGWYIDKNNPYISYLVPTKNGSRSIKSRPTSPYTFTATLKLFASDTENSAIDDGTATALATQDFTFILEAAEVEYKMQVAVQDKDKNPITDASITVEKDGPACHTGTDSCFTQPLWKSNELNEFSLDSLYQLLEGRKNDKPEGSYTTYLFEKGIDKILKKVGEECTEVIIAGKADDKKETVYEIADLAYHVMVLMVQMGISVDDIHRELASRHIIDHKFKQEKMTK